MKKYIAEFFGTFVLTFMGCGAAVFTGAEILGVTNVGPEINVLMGAHVLMTALAFGLAIVAMAYSIGNISGCHVNPAVSLAMLVTKKLSVTDFVGYVVAQLAGAIAGGAVLNAICSMRKGTAIKVVGANGFGEQSAVGLNVGGALLVEVILTCIFVYVILGVTSKVEFANIAGVVIGLTLTFVHIIGINLTGTSVNPARSIGAALFSGTTAISQVWVFIVAPLIGAVIAALLFMFLHNEE